MNCAKIIVRLACVVLWVQALIAADANAQYDLSEAGYDGFAVPVDDITVAAQESGRLDSLFVKVGDRVEAGQVVAKLDDAIQQFAVESAAVVASMRGAFEAARADKNLYELRLSQLRELASKGIARPEELSRAEAEFQVAEARLLAAKEEILVREIDLKRAQEQVRRRQIRTPISGIIAKVFSKPGEFVSPNDPSIVQVINSQSLIGEFNIPAAEALQFQRGQKVKVNAISLATAVVCVVDSIAPMIDGESGTIAVKVRINNSAGKLMPGDRCVMEQLGKPVRVSDLFPTADPLVNPLRVSSGVTKR